MRVRRVDPRGFTSSVLSPSYLVVLWQKQDTDVASGYTAHEYEVSGARDVREVIEWAEKECGEGDGRTFTVDVLSPSTVLRLLGSDPTSNA